MHYYQFNISAWALHTSHLTLEEECIYRRLLDYYYDTELPIPEETKPVIRRLRLLSHEPIVKLILHEFFHLKDDGWHNNRADIEIADYQSKANKARENGKKGGRPKQNSTIETQPVILANPEETTLQANYKLLTKNYELKTNNQKDKDQKIIVPKNKFSDEDKKCAEWIIGKLLEFIPDCKQPNIDGWSEQIRKMRELDNRDHKEICQIWLWCRKDSFEAANVQSPEKLRKRYDQLKTKIKTPATGAKNGNQPKSAIERFMQQHYPDQGAGAENDNGFMGGDDGVVRGKVDSVIWGECGQERAMVADAEWSEQAADIGGFERD